MSEYNLKIISTPYSSEIYFYPTPVLYGFTGKKRSDSNFSSKVSNISEKEKTDKRKNYYKNKTQYIRRLINMNFDNQTKFLTLTFSDNLEDLTDTNYLLNKFIKRLNYRLTKKMKLSRVKYIATWEVQEKRKLKTGKAVIHYHLVLFDFPFIPADELQSIWNHGFIKINQIPSGVSKEKYGSYISKYFTKDLAEKSEHKKAFFTSQNLEKPFEEVMNLDNIQTLKQKLQQSKKLELCKSYSRKIFINNDEYFENETTYMIMRDLNDFKNIIKSSINEQEKNLLIKNTTP